MIFVHLESHPVCHIVVCTDVLKEAKVLTGKTSIIWVGLQGGTLPKILLYDAHILYKYKYHCINIYMIFVNNGFWYLLEILWTDSQFFYADASFTFFESNIILSCIWRNTALEFIYKMWKRQSQLYRKTYIDKLLQKYKEYT